MSSDDFDAQAYAVRLQKSDTYTLTGLQNTLAVEALTMLGQRVKEEELALCRTHVKVHGDLTDNAIMFGRCKVKHIAELIDMLRLKEAYEDRNWFLEAYDEEAASIQRFAREEED